MNWLFIALLAGSVHAATLRVPGEYGTIQSAMDAMMEYDTVLVDTGVYAEALIAPPFSFFMRGNLDSVSEDHRGPIIDPSTLPNPTFQTCLQTIADTAVIAKFVFRNGAAMYPHYVDSMGGIRHRGFRLDLRNCTFDSVFMAIFANGHRNINLSSCDFFDCSGCCALALNSTVTAFYCSFECINSIWASVGGSSGSQIENCSFHGAHTSWHELTLTGSDVVIRNCNFTPSGPVPAGVAYVGDPHDGVIENNGFFGCETGFALGISGSCEDYALVRGNRFRGTARHSELHGGTCLGAAAESLCIGVIIEENAFEDGDARSSAKAISAGGSGIQIRRNRVTAMRPDSLAAMFCQGDILIRDNYFADNGLALRTQYDGDFNDTVDARFNWWGHSTGPYHPLLNPDGQGDEVGDSIYFEPWHTDTLFFLDVPERHPILPLEAKLEVFPNPFNYVARLKLSVAQPLIVRVELFDVLGRNVRELFVGPVADRKEVSLHASELGSGIYFARVMNTIERKQVAMAKVLLLK